jgi:hypothetical protein
MRQITDAQWAQIQENEGGEFPKPTPGGYVGYIVRYEDVERPVKQNGGSQYLRIEWDFAEGEFKLYNRDTYDRAGFWPGFGSFIRSYKDSALPFFKAFKTCLEVSNNGYHFRTDQLDAMRGKKLGIVLGEEEYETNDGEIKKRLYVAQTRSVKAIRDGDFKVPELKKYKPKDNAPAPAYGAPQYAQSQPYNAPQYAQPQPYNDFAELNDDDGELPF